MTSVHFPSNYPIWPLWDPIAWEPRIPFSSEQEVLLFASATIRHGDRKQILIIVWTHREKKITYGSQQNESVLQNTVALCVRFSFPGMLLVLWLEVGLGRWMTSPVVLTFEFWHSGTLCSYSPPTSLPSPLWSLDCAWLCLFFFPLKEYLLFSSSS